MPLVRDDDVERINLTTPGEWVDVKRRLSKGDRVRLTGAAMSMQLRVQGRDIEGEQTFGADALDAITFRGLELGVKAWSFDVPVTLENIRKLDEADYDLLSEECNRLWKPITADEGNA